MTILAPVGLMSQIGITMSSPARKPLDEVTIADSPAEENSGGVFPAAGLERLGASDGAPPGFLYLRLGSRSTVRISSHSDGLAISRLRRRRFSGSGMPERGS